MKNLICKIFGHKLGELEYVKKGDCKQRKKCKRCYRYLEIDKEDNHNWGDWRFIQENSCRQMRSCLKCNKNQKRITHNWGDWFNSSRSCKRCPEQESCYDHNMVVTKTDEEFEGYNPPTIAYVTHESCIICDYERISREGGYPV